MGFGTELVIGLSFNGQARYGTSGETGVPNAQLTLVKRQVCRGTSSDITLSTQNSAGNGKFQLEYPYPACNTGCTCTLRLSIVPPQGYTPVSASVPSPGGVESSTVITYPLVTATTSYTSIYFNLSGSTPPTPAVIQRSYYQFAGRRLALRVSGSPIASENGVFFFMNDHLGGSNVTLKYVTGGLSKVGELRYKAWGESRAADFDEADTPTDLRFTGQRLYEGLGLYHYGARVYDPALGRFLSPDTLVPGRDAAAWDRYAYARENPVRYSDPWAMWLLNIRVRWLEAVI